jgi:hypothetical protein
MISPLAVLTLVAAILFATIRSAVCAPVGETIPGGYPKPVMFRANSPGNLAEDGDLIQMVVSDHLVSRRQYSEEAYKERFPGRLSLIHVGGDFISANAYTPKQMMRDRGLDQGELARKFIQFRHGTEEIISDDFVPMPDFLGYWVYEAGVTNRDAIPADERVVTLKIPDAKRFEPRPVTPATTEAELKQLTGSARVPRIVVICPRDAQAQLDWTRAELGDVLDVNASRGTIRVRRFDTGKGWPAISAGAYVAASAPCWDRIMEWGMANTPKDHPLHYPVWQFFIPNFTPFCPRDPRNGLDAAQWFARHYLEHKKKYFPRSDGYALDVSMSVFLPDTEIFGPADFDNNGVADHAFINGVNWWGLGMNDFLYYLRHGVPGKFEGGRDRLRLTWDATDNGEQRFFHLLNGAEFEHGLFPAGRSASMLSSHLDRLLLWAERGQKPDLTFVSNKRPDEAYHGGTLDELRQRPKDSLSYWRLEMAAACLASGYTHKGTARGNPKTVNYPGLREQVQKYGEPLPQDYDEFHQGDENVRGWLGRPLSPASRLREYLGSVLYAFGEQSVMPLIQSDDRQWRAALPERLGATGLRFKVESIGPFSDADQQFTLRAELPLKGVVFKKGTEYALRFKARGDSSYGQINFRYRPIPRNLVVRLRVDGKDGRSSASARSSRFGDTQECLLFEDQRTVDLTLTASASGHGALEFCLSESPGVMEITDLEIREGCADVLYRPFEHGLVVLNGSKKTPVNVPVAKSLPGQPFRRLKGSQDPKHNNGEVVGDTLTIPPTDGFFLEREKR